jgi:thiosulfate/3-mercaptopyruvate sulfurtransferase
MEKKKFTRLNAAEFAAMLSHDSDNVCVLDSRDADAFAKEHLSGAIRLHTGNLDALILGTPKQRPILIYCYHGNASQQYANMFADFGFAKVHDLIGGFEAWRAYLARTAAESAASPAVLPAPTLLRWMAAQGFTGNDINATIANRSTPLMQAARLGELAIAEELLNCGASLNATNLDGNNALWLACFGGNVALVARLVAKGIAINHQNDNGASCLMYAASAGKTDVVACLLKGGADTSLKSLDDFTALDMAANIECLNLLRKASPRQTHPEPV